jgi:hypothetical protein
MRRTAAREATAGVGHRNCGKNCGHGDEGVPLVSCGVSHGAMGSGLVPV